MCITNITHLQDNVNIDLSPNMWYIIYVIFVGNNMITLSGLKIKFDQKFRRKEELKKIFINRCHNFDESKRRTFLNDSAYISDSQYCCNQQIEINELYRELDQISKEISERCEGEKTVLKSGMLSFKSE